MYIIIIVVYMECEWAIVKKRGGGIYIVNFSAVLIILMWEGHMQCRGLGSTLGTTLIKG